MKYDKIIINIPDELLKDFDQCCDMGYYTRSEGIKQAMRDFIANSRGEDYVAPEQQKEQMKVLFKSMAEAGQELSKDPKFAQLNQQNVNQKTTESLPNIQKSKSKN